MNQQTKDMLTEMRLTAMAKEFSCQIQDASFNSLSFVILRLTGTANAPRTS